MSGELDFATQVVHAGRAEGESGVSPSIQLSTTFTRDPSGELSGDYLYSRLDNPNRRALERCLASLEGGAGALAFSSGSAAMNAILQALPPGSRVLRPADAYHGTAALLEEIFGGGRLRASAVDLTDLSAVGEALDGEAAALVVVETPSNPMLRVTDLSAVSALAHEAGALVLADNTWATPALTRPLEHGCDLVLHSTTKYLGGHSDVTGGAVVAREASGPLWERLLAVQRLAGAVPSPFDCWLTLRGVSTLSVRLRAQCDNAGQVADALADHPAVVEVLYPGDPSHPAYDVVRRQMASGGAMLSFRVAGGEAHAAATVAGLRLIQRATSLGGVHTLAEHRYKVEGEGSTTPRDLIRLSVGVEAARDLARDLEQALAGG